MGAIIEEVQIPSFRYPFLAQEVLLLHLLFVSLAVFVLVTG